jgi:signal transduction histidine kinase
MEIVQSETQDRHVKVSLALEAARRDVLVDAPRLQQVFWNIFRNAYKFTPENAVVSVRSYNPTEHSISIEISDSGIGIEPQFLGKIFEAFEQLDTNREGLGLGLAISKAIIDMHGGRICARSDGLGKGATFLIELPLTPLPSL